MVLTAEQVADRAAAYSEKGTRWDSPTHPGGQCLRFSRTCAGAPGGANDAAQAWREAKYRHTTGTPPRGALVFYTGGSKGYGHVCVSDGQGYVWSTDIVRMSRVDRVSLAYLAARWGNLRYAGWAEDVNGARVGGLGVPAAPTVSLANLRPGMVGGDVTELQLALRRAGYGRLNPSGATGYYGSETTAMVTAYQKAHASLDGLVDGVPGPVMIALLGLHLL